MVSTTDRTGVIRAILFEDWDPIGFGPLLPANEYDSYIPGIVRLLDNRCTVEEMEANLVKIEMEYFGASKQGGKAKLAAKKLVTSW